MDNVILYVYKHIFSIVKFLCGTNPTIHFWAPINLFQLIKIKMATYKIRKNKNKKSL